MRYAAGYSSIPDAYRAGQDVANQIMKAAPELVVLFCSNHYFEQASELAAAMKDTLGGNVLCCGCTGDGVYWSGGAANLGVVALGIHSEGQSKWAATLARGLGPQSATTARQAAERLREQLGVEPTFSLVFADGCQADGARLVEGLGQVLRGPCLGGLAADDRKFIRSAVFLGDEVAQDALILIGASGGVPFGVSAASGWSPMGERGTVTSAVGTKVLRVDDKPANTFIRDQIGQAVRSMDLGIVPLAEYPDPAGDRYVLRTSSAVDEATGEVALFGRIPEGSIVRVCRATMGEIVDGVDTALSEASRSGFKPAAALLISCAGRRWLLTEAGSEEVARVRQRLGDIPLIGLPSFGEIAPFRRSDGNYSPTLFHNVTFVACLLGS